MQGSLGTLCLGLVHNQGNLDPTLDGVDQGLRDILVCERVGRHLDGFRCTTYTSKNLLFNSSFWRKEGRYRRLRSICYRLNLFREISRIPLWFSRRVRGRRSYDLVKREF